MAKITIQFTVIWISNHKFKYDIKSFFFFLKLDPRDLQVSRVVELARSDKGYLAQMGCLAQKKFGLGWASHGEPRSYTCPH